MGAAVREIGRRYAMLRRAAATLWTSSAAISYCDVFRRRGAVGKPLLLKKAERRFHLHTADYARLAAFPPGLREFLRFGRMPAERVRLLSQHYQRC